MSEIRANSITDAAGTGAPNFPNGLESDGVAVATTADINSALEFISSATISNVATVDFTGFDSSKYSDYVFSLSNVIPVTDAQDLKVLLSTNGGSSFGETYDRNYFWWNDAITGGAQTSTTYSVLGVRSVGSDANEFGVSGEVRVFGPALSARTYVTGFFRSAHASLGQELTITSGNNQSTSAVNGVRFQFASGNLESGTITMYGVRKS